MDDRIIPLIKRKAPLLDLFRQKVGVQPEDLTEAQKRLAEDFKRGIASSLGVPPEAIRQDLIERWVIGWTRAVTKPEYWKQGQQFGRELGRILAQILPPRGTGLVTGRAGERRLGTPRTEEERAKRHFDISVG